MIRRLTDRLRGRDGEAGLTLIETLVAILIFSIVITVFMTGIIQMSKVTRTVEANTTASSQIAASFFRLDKEVRYAEAINQPGQDASGNWYVEMELDSGSSGTCIGWRYDPSLGTLATRTWSAGSTPSTWFTQTSGLVTPTSSEITAAGLTSWQPFTMATVSGSSVNQNQELAVDVFAQPLSSVSTVHESRAIFVARNTSSATDTNTTGDYVCSPASGPTGYRGE